MKPALPPSRRTVDMVEDGRVVVRHVFFGRDAAEAKHMEEAHREADKSLDASMSGEKFEGTDIKAVRPKRNPKVPAGVLSESRSIIETGSRIWDKLRERNAREVGWTPEARAAALVARQHGYKATGGGGPAALTMRHPEGHRVTIAPSGEWGHSGAEKGGQKGYGEYSLYQHLTSVHGAPKQEAEVKDAGGHGSDAHSASVAIRQGHAAKAGSVYNGIHPMIGEPDHHMFTDLKYGSTFTVPIPSATLGAVKAAADAKREQMRAGGAKLSTPEERRGMLDQEEKKYGPRKKAVEVEEGQEVGWTDEARMAAAIARRAGYERHGSGQFGDHYIHPGDRHALRIDPNGRWEHVRAPLHKGWSTKGEGAEALAKHLAGVHAPRQKTEPLPAEHSSMIYAPGKEAGEAKDARGHGSERRVTVYHGTSEKNAAAILRGGLNPSKSDWTVASDPNTAGAFGKTVLKIDLPRGAHKEYLDVRGKTSDPETGKPIYGVMQNIPASYISRHGAAAKSEAEAKDEKGHGSEKRSVFAPASHEEPSPVRVETPGQRAERIRAMKVPADRAAVIRKAMGYKRSEALREVRAELVAR